MKEQDDMEVRMLLETMTTTLENSIRTISKIEDHRHKESTQTRIVLTGLSVLFLILCYFTWEETINMLKKVKSFMKKVKDYISGK